MTMYGGTFATYATIGIREELSNKISNIAPYDTPVLTNSGKGKMRNTYTEWQQDTLAAAVTTNKQLEGDNITTADAAVATVRVGCHAQISRKTLSVSGTDEAVDRAGRGKEAAYQIMKKGKELKTDIEATILSAQIDAAGNATTARATPGLLAWIKTNVNCTVTANTQTYTTVPNARRTDGAQRTATESMLQDVIQKCWTQGGDVTTVVVNGTNKTVISGFTGISTKYNEMTANKPGVIYGAADTYVSNFGVVKIVADRFARSNDGFVLDFKLLEVADLRGFRVEQLAKTGDAEQSMLLREWAFKVENEAGIGLIADIGG